jgi:hypothetical protein
MSLALTMGVSAQQPPGSVPQELIAYPSLILHNGKVITVDGGFTIAQAVAVRDRTRTCGALPVLPHASSI